MIGTKLKTYGLIIYAYTLLVHFTIIKFPLGNELYRWSSWYDPEPKLYNEQRSWSPEYVLGVKKYVYSQTHSYELQKDSFDRFSSYGI